MKTGIIPAIAYGELRAGLAVFAKLHLRSAAILAAFHASLADWEAALNRIQDSPLEKLQ